METIQIIAHFLLIGDVILFLKIIISPIASIIKYLIITIILTILISAGFYALSLQANSEYLQNIINEGKVIFTKLKTGADL